MAIFGGHRDYRQKHFEIIAVTTTIQSVLCVCGFTSPDVTNHEWEKLEGGGAGIPSILNRLKLFFSSLFAKQSNISAIHIEFTHIWYQE